MICCWKNIFGKKSVIVSNKNLIVKPSTIKFLKISNFQNILKSKMSSYGDEATNFNIVSI